VSRPTFSGEDIISALDNWDYKKVGQTGSHAKLRYINPDTGEKRTVIVPYHNELDTGTLKSIAEQAGARDFQNFLDEMEKMV
jgi:predicted RNA binding protein YcfA (HicA-like mRNA interferase family)